MNAWQVTGRAGIGQEKLAGEVTLEKLAGKELQVLLSRASYNNIAKVYI